MLYPIELWVPIGCPQCRDVKHVAASRFFPSDLSCFHLAPIAPKPAVPESVTEPCSEGDVVDFADNAIKDRLDEWVRQLDQEFDAVRRLSHSTLNGLHAPPDLQRR